MILQIFVQFRPESMGWTMVAQIFGEHATLKITSWIYHERTNMGKAESLFFSYEH